MKITNKIFFALILFIQVYLLSALSFIASNILIGSLIIYTLFSFLRPLWALSLFLAAIPLFGTALIESNNMYSLGFTSATLLGIYADLLFRNKIRLQRFMIKVRFSNILLVLIFFYVISLLLGLIGQALYSLYHQLFILNNPQVLTDLFNLSSTSELYPLKSVLIVIESILLGVYTFGITKPSNQVRILHHLLLAIVFGLVFSFFIVSLYYFNIFEISSLYMETTAFTKYLIITLPLLPVILLLHKINRFYFSLITILIIIGGVSFTLAMELSAFVTYPLISLAMWSMVYFIFIRVKHKRETFRHFLKYHWVKVFITFLFIFAFTLTGAFGIKIYFKKENLFSTTSIEYKDQQKLRSNILTTGLEVFRLNPIYGTGYGSFTWKVQKLNGTYANSKNLYLETIVGAGIFGLLFFIGFVALLFYKLLKKEFSLSSISIENSILGLIVVTSLFTSLIYANSTNIFDFYPLQIIFWLIVFIGVSLTHSYHVTTTQRYRAKKFLEYASYSIFYFFIIHLLNFTIVKESVVSTLNIILPTVANDSLFSLISYLLGIFIIGIISSFVIHSKVIFYSDSDSLFVDEHGANKSHAIHKTPTPRAGGIGIFIVNIFLVFNPLGWKLLLISLPTFIVGLLDDAKSISPTTRLFFQSLSAILAIFFLNALAYSLGFNITLPLFFSIFISLLAIVGVTNALNIIDGFNGLSSGIALMLFLSLAYVSLELNDIVVFEVVAINIIALLGFLVLNFPKGKIFLGDGGAYFLGFSLVTIALVLAYTNKNVSAYYPLALLIYPVWEVVFSIYRRKFVKKVKSTDADKLHIHQLIYKRITKNNPRTSVYIWKRVTPFVIVTTFFYDNDFVLLGVILVFVLSYNLLYKMILTRQVK